MGDTPRYLNRVELRGNLTGDPEVRTLANGSTVGNVQIATNEFRKNKETDKWEVLSTEYHRVTVWNEEVLPILEKSIRKGDLVSLVGKIKTRTWTATDNSTRSATDIVVDRFGEFALVEKKREHKGYGGPIGKGIGGVTGGGKPYAPPRVTHPTPTTRVEPIDDDQEIPF